MGIVDVHVHVYEKKDDQAGNPVEHMLSVMDESGVEKAVMMSNPFYGYHNAYLASCVRQYPERLRGVALVDVRQGRAAADELEKIYQEGILFGMKVESVSSFQGDDTMSLGGPRMQAIFECCDAYGQPFFIHPFTDRDYTDIVELSERYKRVRFVVCHLGADASFQKRKRAEAFEGFLQLCRRRDNVFFDISTVPEYFPEAYPFPAAQKVIEYAAARVGAERMMWGTDYPGMAKMADYRRLGTYFLDGCPAISASDKDKIAGQNAEKLFWQQNAVK